MNGDSSSNPTSFLAEFDAPELLNLLADGAYITDTDRRIVFWNQAAQRITGWGAAEVVGRTCRTTSWCTWTRTAIDFAVTSIARCTGASSPASPAPSPLLVFAQHRSGARIPVEVTVSPVRNHAGQVIGGIEVFRDLTESVQDQLRAKEIQEWPSSASCPKTNRVSFEMRYQPRDIVGGDFFRMWRRLAMIATPFSWPMPKGTAWRRPCTRCCCGHCARSTARTWTRRRASWAS